MIQYLSPSHRKLQKVFACHPVSLRAKKYHNTSTWITLYELNRYSDKAKKHVLLRHSRSYHGPV